MKKFQLGQPLFLSEVPPVDGTNKQYGRQHKPPGRDITNKKQGSLTPTTNYPTKQPRPNDEVPTSSASSETSEQTASTSTQPAASSLKALSSSASKPPPSHPILKKIRGPSSSGPRPTARFATPHDSGDEDDRESDVPSSGSTAVAGSEMKGVSSLPKKKSGKKFVASSGSKSSKRRPMLPRRASSQSSTASENAGSSATTRTTSLQRPVSPIPEKPSTSTTPQSQEDYSLVPPPGMSAKAAGKRPIQQKEKVVVAETESVGKEVTEDELRKKKRPTEPLADRIAKPEVKKESPKLKQAASPKLEQKQSPKPYEKKEPLLFDNRGTLLKEALASSPSATLSQVQSMIDLTSHRRKSSQPPIIGTDATLSSSHSPSSFGTSPAFMSTAMGRSSSHTGYERSANLASQSWSNRRPPTSGLFTKTTASTTNVAALGTIIDQSGVGSLPDSSAFDTSRREEYILPSRGSSASLLDGRMMPTQPSTSTSVPLGRTKSQLTVLLERDQERNHSQSRSRN